MGQAFDWSARRMTCAKHIASWPYMRVILTLLGSVFGTRRHRHLRCFAWKPCLLDPQLLEAYSYVFLKRSRRLELFMVAWYVGILYADFCVHLQAWNGNPNGSHGPSLVSLSWLGAFRRCGERLPILRKIPKRWLLNLIRAMHAVETSQLETLRHGKLS